MAAGNTLEQSVAMIAAANKVVQDPNSVGSALRTISLRIRGTSVKELEELGEETEGAVESVSKLQEKIKGLTGVDILTDAGAYKDTYTILKEIAEVWPTLDDMSRAGALEMLAGKNRSNTLAALLTNIEDLEGAYEAALNAEGSAMAENEKYLDSIQGKVDQFNNALQTMWNNLITSDAIKGVVELGTALIEIVSTLKLGGTLAAAFVSALAFKPLLSSFKEFGSGLKNAASMGFNQATSGTVSNVADSASSIANAAAMQTETAALERLNAAKIKAAVLNTNLSNAKKDEILSTILSTNANGVETLSVDANTAAKLEEALVEMGLSVETAKAIALSYAQTEANTVEAISFNTLTAGIVGATKAMLAFLVKTPIGWAILAAGALAGSIALFDALTVSTEEHAEKLKDLKTEYEEASEAVKSLQNELKTTQERMEELEAIGNNRSFAEEEELIALQKKNDELQRELDIRTQLQNLKQKEVNKEFVETMESAEGDVKSVSGAGNYVGDKTSGEMAEYDIKEYSKYAKMYEDAQKEYQNALSSGNEQEIKTTKAYMDHVANLRDKSLNGAVSYYEALSKYASGVSYIEDPKDDADKAVNEWLDYYNNLGDKIAIATGGENALFNAFTRVSGKKEFTDELEAIKNAGDETGESLLKMLKFNEDGTLKASEGDLNDFIQTLIDCGFIANTTAEELQKVADAIYKTGQFSGVSIDPSFKISDYATSIDNVQSSISSYRSALESLESGDFSYDDFIDLVQQFPELADGVDASSKSFNGLSKNLRKAIKNAPDELVDDLKDLRDEMKKVGKDTTSIDQLITSLENLPTNQLDSLAAKYGVVADSISEAAQNANELNNTLGQDTNTGYTTRISAMEEMMSLMEKGAVGSESNLWNIASEFFGKDARELFKQGADALYEMILLREQWYQEGEDGGYSFEGIENFIEYVDNSNIIESLGGIWEYDGESFNFDFNGKTFEEVAAAIGISKDELTDLINQIGQFFSITWTDGKDIVSYLNALSEKVGDPIEKLEDAKDVVTSLLENNDLSLDFLDPSSAGLGEFKALPADIQKALEAYWEFVDIVNSFPINLSSGELITSEDIKSLESLTGILYDNEAEVAFVDFSNLENAAREAGYSEEAINNLLNKIKEYNNVIDISATEDDPLGLGNLTATADETMNYLKLLEIEVARVTEGGVVSLEIGAQSFVDQMVALGWDSGQISAYMQSLNEQGYTFKIGSEALSFDDASLAETQEKINGLVASASTVTTTYDVNGDGIVKLSEIITSWGIVTAPKSTVYTIYERTIRTSSSGLFGRLFGGNSAESEVNGSARINGTAKGKAFTSGNWGLAHDEKDALVGELGMETVVDPNTGRYYTVGDTGAEFVDLPKGAIIFNHKQTEELFKHGYVTGRGKAYASGNAFPSGRGNLKKYVFSGTDVEEIAKDASASENDKAEKETLDFIEIKIEEIEALISKITAKIENFLDDTTDTLRKGSYYDQLVNAEKNKAETFLAAVEVYNKKAADLLTEIPEQYKAMAQNGALAIEDFLGDEQKETIEAINEYREWAQKADDAEVGYLEAIAQAAAYRVEQLEDIASDFENLTNQIETQSDLVQSYIDLVEESGELVSAGFYKDLIDRTTKQLDTLKDERVELQKILNDSVMSGDIIKGTDEWFEMVEAIYEVDAAILDAKINIEEFNNSILELHWENFERIKDSLTNISEEASRVREIIRDIDLTDEKGNWTKEGITALGMAAQEMENAKYQADLYNEQIETLNKQYKAGLYSETEYTEKLAELKDGQWESIEAYESAKDALVDLNKARIEAVKEGIQKEIDAYEELIEKRKEDLDAQKDAHDWSNQVKSHTDEIEALQRQIDAMSGDSSAAGIAARKKLEEQLAEAQRELDEAYYDRDIEMQQKSLDDSLEAYRKDKEKRIEELDEYLKQEDQVIADSYALILANTESVMAGLQEISDRYGISISDNVTSPWEAGMTALGTYGEELDYATSNYVNMLERVRKELIDMQLQADKTADATLDALSASEKKTQNAVPNTPSKAPTTVAQPSLTVGSQITVKKSATNFSRDGGNGTKMDNWVPGSTFTVYETKGNEVLIGKPGEGYTGWIRKQDIVGYATGTTGVKKDQLAWIDENGLEELVLHADGGKLSYLTKGTSVIPADITSNLMELGQVDYRTILDRNRPEITAPGIISNNFEVNLSFGELLHVDNMSQDAIPEVQKMIRSEFDNMMKQLNSGIRKYAR